MTLVIACYTPNGIALSADSRTTGLRQQSGTPPGSAGTNPVTVQVPWVMSDSARKLFVFKDRFALGAWGDALIAGLPTAHHVNDYIQANEATSFATTEAFVDALIAHFSALAPGANIGFAVAGYDAIDPRVYEIAIGAGTKKRWNWDAQASAVQYGAFYGGDWDIVGRLLGSNAAIPWALMNLQDAVDVTRHLIRTTIDQMRFEARIATVGGLIDTAVVTGKRARFLVRKELHV
jgi:hypothetical protein